MNNEHISNAYQIPSPDAKNTKQQPKKYKNSDGKNLKYQNQLEKYYEYNDLYKRKKYVIDRSPYGSLNKIVPNRKLSPLNNKKLIKIN